MADITTESEFEIGLKNITVEDNFTQEVMRQWRHALQHKRATRVGDYSLDELLRHCHDARENKTSCAEEQLRARYPEWAAMPISIVSFKTGILNALIRETLIDVADAPFIVDPTPNPEIPAEIKTRFIKELERKLINEMDVNTLTADDMVELVKQAKVQALAMAKDHAKEQALIAQNQIYDKTVEGGYRQMIMEFSDDFAVYPFACLHGPFPVIQQDSEWKNGKIVEVEKMVWSFERISPFDVFWTEDSTDTQSGTAVFIRKTQPLSYLYNALDAAKKQRNETGAKRDGFNDSGYQLEAIQDLLDKATKGETIPRFWTEFHLTNPEKTSNLLSAWRHGDNVEILIRYGRFEGFRLRDMGITGVEDYKTYETKVVVCGGRVIQVHLNNNPTNKKRPVFITSFEKSNGTMVGTGLGQKLLPLHNAYRSCISLAMYNLGLSSEPVTEVDMERVAEYMDDDFINNPKLTPGQVFPVTTDRIGQGRALQFTQIPNITGQALSIAQNILELSHVISNIPAALHGQPVGSGANRTVRGLLTLQGNTLKPIQSSLANLDLDVIEPMVRLVYMLLALYDDDFTYSGDAKIVAHGAANMIAREMEKQDAMESLQLLGQFGDKVNDAIIERTAIRVLELSKVIEPGEQVFKTPMAAQPTAQPPMQVPIQTADSAGLPPTAPMVSMTPAQQATMSGSVQ